MKNHPKDTDSYIVDPRKFDHLGLYRSGIRRFISSFRLKSIERAVALQPKIQNVLDAGCGHGYTLAWIHSPYSQYIGVEINSNSVRLAKQRLEGKSNVNIFEGDITNLQFPSDTFDTVICTEVLEHLPNPELALQEINRVLKSGGRIITTVPFEYLLVGIRLILWPHFKMKGEGIFEKTHLHFFTKTSFRRLMEKYFIIEQVKRVEFGLRIMTIGRKQ